MGILAIITDIFLKNVILKAAYVLSTIWRRRCVFSIFVVWGFYLYPKRFLIALFKISAFISFFALLLFHPLPTLLVFGILAILVPFFYTDKGTKPFKLKL